MKRPKHRPVWPGLLAVLAAVCLLGAACAADDDSAQDADGRDPTSQQQTDAAPDATAPASGAVTSDTSTGEADGAGDDPTSLPENAAPPSAPAAPGGLPAPSVCGALRVEGNALVDSNGAPVQLRGVSTHGLAWFPQYVNEDCFRQLHDDWGANLIRLALYTAESGGWCTGGDQRALRALVDTGVQAAAAADMYVILDWHILSDGDPNQHIEEAKAFFTDVSAAYADCDHVLYEICNEPNGGVGWADIKSYAETIIPVIRAQDPDAVVLVGTPNWCQYLGDAAADPLTGYDNILYTLHFYAATHKEDLRATLTAALDAGLPVFVSEFGICDASGNGGLDLEQAAAWMSLLEERGISYAAWNLSNKNESSALLRPDCAKTAGFGPEDLSAAGSWLCAWLRAARDGVTGDAAPPPATVDGANAPAQPQRPASPTPPTAGADKATDGGTDQVADHTPKGNSALGADAASDAPAPGVNATNSTPLPGADGTADVVFTQEQLAVTATVRSSWESDGTPYTLYDLTLQNTADTACTGWCVQLRFAAAFTLTDSWCGTFTAQDTALTIASLDYNGAIPPGESVSGIGFIVAGGGGLVA